MRSAGKRRTSGRRQPGDSLPFHQPRGDAAGVPSCRRVERGMTENCCSRSPRSRDRRSDPHLPGCPARLPAITALRATDRACDHADWRWITVHRLDPRSSHVNPGRSRIYREFPTVAGRNDDPAGEAEGSCPGRALWGLSPRLSPGRRWRPGRSGASRPWAAHRSGARACRHVRTSQRRRRRAPRPGRRPASSDSGSGMKAAQRIRRATARACSSASRAATRSRHRR